MQGRFSSRWPVIPASFNHPLVGSTGRIATLLIKFDVSTTTLLPPSNHPEKAKLPVWQAALTKQKTITCLTPISHRSDQPGGGPHVFASP